MPITLNFLISSQKASARKAAKVRRQDAQSGSSQANAIENARELAIGQAAGRPIAGYLAIGTELDPSTLLANLHRDQGCTVCVPVVMGKNERLRFRSWTPQSKLSTGPFGVKIPASGDWLTPYLVFVPMLAFDRMGYRLGYGGGFYDRTLRFLRAAAPTIAVGLAFGEQEQDVVPRDQNDEKLDVIVTNREIIDITGIYQSTKEDRS